MNRKAALFLTLFATSFVADGATPSSPVMTPGRWEVTIKTHLPDATPTSVTEVCISKEATERLDPPKGKPTDDCQVTGGLHSNLLKYDIKCGRKNLHTKAEFTYSGDRYEGVLDITTDEFSVRQTYSAKRIGDCETP